MRGGGTPQRVVCPPPPLASRTTPPRNRELEILRPRRGAVRRTRVLLCLVCSSLFSRLPSLVCRRPPTVSRCRLAVLVSAHGAPSRPHGPRRLASCALPSPPSSFVLCFPAVACARGPLGGPKPPSPPLLPLLARLRARVPGLVAAALFSFVSSPPSPPSFCVAPCVLRPRSPAHPAPPLPLKPPTHHCRKKEKGDHQRLPLDPLLY